MEMQVYISNLGKYNEGELVGAWFTPPIDPEIVKEKIGLDSEYEEYAIHDYELSFDINEYTSIEDINRLCALAEELSGTPIESESMGLPPNTLSTEESIKQGVTILLLCWNPQMQKAVT